MSVNSISSAVLDILDQEGVTSLSIEGLYNMGKFLTKRTGNPQYLRYTVRVGRMMYRDAFTDADPFKLLFVDPASIEYTRLIYTDRGTHAPRERVIPAKWGRVAGGQWTVRRFDTTRLHRSMRMRFLDGVAWEETPIYRDRLEKIERGQPTYGVRTKTGLEAKLDRLDEIYETIRTKGYKTQRDCLENCSAASKPGDPDAVNPFLNEITVNIGPNGELIRSGGGRHRLSIAKLLELDTIPVLVRTRHTRWQSLRDSIQHYGTLPSDRLRRHPDLQDVLTIV